MFDLSKLAELDSATKYPSIETYHELGEKGSLTETLGPFGGFDDDAYLTEKVDGTNGRIVLTGDDYFIGSRDALLHARGDRVLNPNLGIVAALRDLAEFLVEDAVVRTGEIHAVYLEVYGGKIQAAREYTREGQVGFRMFDYGIYDAAVLGKPREEIALWRERGGQEFMDEGRLRRFAQHTQVPLVPRVGMVPGSSLPQSVDHVYEWLQSALPGTLVGLDASGKSEGLVIRSRDRRTIAKARFQDYERTIKRRK